MSSRRFAGQNFAIHPLDVTDMQVLTAPDGKHNFTVCVNAFTDIGTIAGGETDALFGDSFLRNVYTAFDFGTGGPTKGTPFVQMLSTTDATKSAADYIAVRAATMASMPPELAPADLIKVFAGTLNAADAVPVTISAPASTAAGSSTPSVGSTAGSNAAATTAAGGAPAPASSASGKPSSASRVRIGSSVVVLLLAAVVGVAALW